MLHKQSPRPGSVLGSEAGGGRHDLAGSKPEQRQQTDEEAAPAHDPNLKNSRPRSDMLRGLLSFFMEKNHAFRGAAVLIFCPQALPLQ